MPSRSGCKPTGIKHPSASLTAGRWYSLNSRRATASTLARRAPCPPPTSDTAFSINATIGGSCCGHNHASLSPSLPCALRRSFPTFSRHAISCSAISASSALHRSAWQNPYLRRVREAFASSRSLYRCRARKSSLYFASWNAACSGRSVQNTKCLGCFTRVTATYPRPTCAADLLLRQMRTRLNVIPCAFW